MTTTAWADEPELQALPVTHPSLAHGVPDRAEGMLYVKSLSGGVRLPPRDGRAIRFGRNLPEVQVCVGGDDRNVSRVQGVVEFRHGAWLLSNTGRRNLQLPRDQQLFTQDDPYPLEAGYTPVFIRTAERRTHLVEIYVSDGSGGAPRPVFGEPTFDGHRWQLSREEKLALVATAQPYLMHERNPEPWARGAVSALLREVDPGGNWSKPKVGRVVDRVRARLADQGVPNLTASEVGNPIGNRLKHNLVIELMASCTLVPPDVGMLD